MLLDTEQMAANLLVIIRKNMQIAAFEYHFRRMVIELSANGMFRNDPALLPLSGIFVHPFSDARATVSPDFEEAFENAVRQVLDTSDEQKHQMTLRFVIKKAFEGSISPEKLFLEVYTGELQFRSAYVSLLSSLFISDSNELLYAAKPEYRDVILSVLEEMISEQNK